MLPFDKKSHEQIFSLREAEKSQKSFPASAFYGLRCRLVNENAPRLDRDHFRVTLLPDADEIADVFERIESLLEDSMLS